MEKDLEATKIVTKKRKWPKRLLFCLLILCLLLISLPFVIHINAVQNWLVNIAADKMSQSTGAEVSVDKVDFSVFKGFELYDIYISDPQVADDTLAYVGYFASSLEQSVLSLTKRKLYLNELSLKNARIHIKTKKGEEKSNIEHFFSSLSTGGSKKSGKSKPFYLGLNKVNFETLELIEDNQEKGSYNKANLALGRVDIDKIDIEAGHFIIKELLLSEPYVKLEKRKNEGNATLKPKSPDSKSNPTPDSKSNPTPDSKSNPTPDSKSHSTTDTQHTHIQTPNSAGVNAKKEGAKETARIKLEVHFVEISNGEFYLDDWRKGEPQKVKALDTKHLTITNLNLNADSTVIELPFSIRSQIKSMTLSEGNGFRVKQFDVGQLIVDEEQLSLANFAMETSNSRLGENLNFRYDDFSDFKAFATEIEIDALLEDSKVSFSDLTYFFPEIKNSPFIKLNKNKWVKLTGDIKGTVNDIDAEDLVLSFSNLIELRGSLSTNGLTDAENALFNLHVSKLSTSLANLKQVIPNFNPPQQFYKLDPIQFRGDIDGFFKDFVLYGELDSPLGKVELDTRLNIKKGTENAEYSGEISLNKFNLNAWTGNPDLGFVTAAATITDGRGLKLDNLYADLSAELSSFDYKGYSYSDVRLDGEFEENLFNGKFVSGDPNAQVDFDGVIKLRDGVMSSDFKANIGGIDLKALNLSKDFSDVKGRIDLTLNGSNTNDAVGAAIINDLSLNFRDKLFEFDSLVINSSPNLKGQRNVVISSEIIDGTIYGNFDFGNLVPAFKAHVLDAHPQWAQKLKIKRTGQAIKDQGFKYKFRISDTKDYLELVKVDDLRIVNLELEGEIDTERNYYKSKIDVGEIDYKEMVFDNVHLDLLENGNRSNHALNLERFQRGNFELNPIELLLKGDGDVVDLSVKTSEIMDSVQSIDLTLHAFPDGQNIVVNVADGQIKMLSSTWEINPYNEVIYGDKKIEINGFILDDGYRKIVVSDINQKGVIVDLEKFDFLIINGIIDYDKIKFTGEGNIIALKENLFEPCKALLKLSIPEFRLNDVDYGTLTVEATDDNTDVVTAEVLLKRDYDDLLLNVKADYNKDSKTIDGVITGEKIVMNTFEFILSEGIHNTGGYADVNAVVSGPLDNLKIDGVGQVTDGTTTIDYLGSELYFGPEKFIITDKVIDLSGGTLRDRYGNVADIQGRLTHKLFTKFESDIRMSSDKFLALDTDKTDNPAYYGQGIGAVVVDFTGPFSSTDIVVNATSSPGTVINIPVGEVYEDFDKSFIKLVNREDIFNTSKLEEIAKAPKIEGVDVRMNLTVTKEARVNIIFNESTNDIMKGRGDGNMRVVISRKGEFNIFGDYVIDEGEYLFTYFGGVISKPFKVKKGGLITWTGDPVNANINLEASYAKLRSPVNVFLAEYLSPQARIPARRRTDIDLKMFLTGTLYKPTVNFDINFPELQSELKTLADSKMRILRTNEADLNEQVAGLIMFGSFLPSSSLGNTVSSANGVISTGYNTISEMVSNQLSYILSGFLQEALTENGFVSGIDFELGFSRNSSFADNVNDPGNNNNLLPDEVAVHLKPRFQNDRWELDYGTSYVYQDDNNVNQDYVIHDFNIGFYLTDDRRLKIRAYGKWDQNIQQQRGYKYGLGLNYSKEFGSLTDFKKEFSEDLAKLKLDKADSGNK